MIKITYSDVWIIIQQWDQERQVLGRDGTSILGGGVHLREAWQLARMHLFGLMYVRS